MALEGDYGSFALSSPLWVVVSLGNTQWISESKCVHGILFTLSHFYGRVFFAFDMHE
jgi:hypothetical protein